MVKALLKKQMLEVFSWVVRNQKTGKFRDKKGMIGFVVLYLFLFGYLGVMFYLIADMLCAPLVSIGFGWLYMALMGLISVTLGVFGSVFSTYSSLYQAKDNDLLLSMPVPVNKVLFVRLAGVYVMGLMYALLVLIPALIVYLLNTPFHILSLMFCLLIPVVLSFFVLSLSCILGWVVAIVSSKLKNQKIITVLLCLGFIAAYYYLCGNMSTLLQEILFDPADFGSKVQGILYPLYQMGLAAEGNILAMLIFAAITLAVYTAVYFVLHRSFLKLATTNRGDKKVKYIHKRGEHRSVAAALMFKELRRFFGSVNYMMNCGLGLVFMVIAGVFLIIKRAEISLTCSLLGDEGVIALLACAAICTMTAMNDMTAPSVSLEGKSLWILQVLPVSAWQVLKAKLSVHLLLCLVPTAVLTICVLYALKLSALYVLLIPLVVILFSVLMAVLGLVFNLKMPNLDWTNEVVPIKQSASVALTLFGGWVLVLALGGIYYLFRNIFTPVIYMVCVIALVSAVDAFLLRWLKKSGTKIFDTL